MFVYLMLWVLIFSAAFVAVRLYRAVREWRGADRANASLSPGSPYTRTLASRGYARAVVARGGTRRTGQVVRQPWGW